MGLISNTVLGLRALLQLSEEYCYKYHVKQVPDKTKLLVFFPKSTSSVTDLELSTNCLKLGGTRVLLSIKATHVGRVWSLECNGYVIADQADHRVLNRTLFAKIGFQKKFGGPGKLEVLRPLQFAGKGS